VKIVTLNFWGSEPPLDKRLALAARQLKALAPDVVCLQEARAHTTDSLATSLGMHGHYSTSTQWDGGEEGLAILTREAAADLRKLVLPVARPDETRILLSAKIGDIWVHTTHLHYRLDDGVAREAQVLAIDAEIRALGRDNTSPPQILCGDFNATPDSDEMRFLRGLTTLEGRRTHFQDAWLRHHPHDDGITWSSENELTRPLRSLDIDRRIDFIYVTSRKKDGRATIRDCRVVLDAREDGICASDHYGVYADVQTTTS
jgi:endonuclease/exonuclease/phosphatase family metal-dependent hydrolase